MPTHRLTAWTEYLHSDRRAEHQGGINLGPFWGAHLGCLTLLVVTAATACVPWPIKVALVR